MVLRSDCFGLVPGGMVAVADGVVVKERVGFGERIHWGKGAHLPQSFDLDEKVLSTSPWESS